MELWNLKSVMELWNYGTSRGEKMEIYDDVENENSKGYVVLNMIRNISESIELLL